MSLIQKYRKCTVCKKYRLTTDYYKCTAKKDGISYRCKKCDDKARQKWRNENPEKSRESAKFRNIKCKYGLSKKAYNDLLELQNNKCAICKTDNPRTLNTLSFCVDHDHKTNKVRGLLCSLCNRSLGFLKDDIQIVKSMMEYLKTYNSI